MLSTGCNPTHPFTNSENSIAVPNLSERRRARKTTIMAAESVRAASSVCSFNGYQRRPAKPLSRTPFLIRSSRPSSSFTLSSRSQFFGRNLRFASSASSKLFIQNRHNLSVIAMAAEGILSCHHSIANIQF